MIVSFIPWILFWILAGKGMPEPAAAAAFFTTLVFIIVEKIRGRSLKILQVGTLAFFLVLSALALATELDRFSAWVNFGANFTLTAIVLFSIVIGKPFTLQYAKEQTPENFWTSPVFIRINYTISWVWCLVFLVNLIPSTVIVCGGNVPAAVRWTASIVLFIAAAKFTKWYPQHIKKAGKP